MSSDDSPNRISREMTSGRGLPDQNIRKMGLKEGKSRENQSIAVFRQNSLQISLKVPVIGSLLGCDIRKEFRDSIQ